MKMPMPQEIAMLDLRGLRCPLPVLRTARQLSRMQPGEGLIVLADDPLATLDIAHHCREAGHRLIAATTLADHARFEIECAGPAAKASPSSESVATD